MTISPDELRDAVGCKLAQLLKDDEAGWYNAACWIDKMAIEKGVDLAADFETPERFAKSLIDGTGFHTDLQLLFPNGVDDLERVEVAEELFWKLMPRSESDYSAFEPKRYCGPLLFRCLTRILRAVAGRA
jgi:hypothetical protein